MQKSKAEIFDVLFFNRAIFTKQNIIDLFLREEVMFEFDQNGETYVTLQDVFGARNIIRVDFLTRLENNLGEIKSYYTILVPSSPEEVLEMLYDMQRKGFQELGVICKVEPSLRVLNGGVESSFHDRFRWKARSTRAS
jgi:hypothetical protein